MLREKATVLMVMLATGLYSCSFSDSTAKDIIYVQDKRTNLCFAMMAEIGGGYDVRSMTCVPCEPVKKFLVNP